MRSTSALIQTIGRAARNVNGFVVMYADRMTDAMNAALGETDRRRAKQVAYNEKHGITPQTILKAIKDIAMFRKKEEIKRIDTKRIPKAELQFVIQNLEQQMELASENLEFEKAASLRDEINRIKATVEK